MLTPVLVAVELSSASSQLAKLLVAVLTSSVKAEAVRGLWVDRVETRDEDLLNGLESKTIDLMVDNCCRC